MTNLTTATLLAAVLSLGVAAGCGSDDDAADSTSVAAESAAESDTGGTESDTGDASDAGESGGGDGSGGLTDGEIADQVLDEMGEQGDVIADAIDSLPDETIWRITADQLDATDFEIDGATIRLIFDNGRADDALFDCAVAGSFVDDGQTLIAVYPDGDVTC